MEIAFSWMWLECVLANDLKRRTASGHSVLSIKRNLSQYLKRVTSRQEDRDVSFGGHKALLLPQSPYSAITTRTQYSETRI